MTREQDWCIEEYATDIHNYLRSKEKKRYYFRGQSPQLHMRKCLIEWLTSIWERFEFCTLVQHLAVYLLDIFMDNHTIHCDHLQMVALGCLIVAVKVEEKDFLIPKNSEFNALMGNKYKLIEFVQMEVSILNFFNWDILFPTAAHFVNYYSLYVLSPTDSFEDGPQASMEQMKLHAQKYMDYFLELSLQNEKYLEFLPSVVAAACMMSARICLLLEPDWPECLQNLTGIKISQLQPCVGMFLRALEADVQKSKNSSRLISNKAKQYKSNGKILHEHSNCLTK